MIDRRLISHFSWPLFWMTGLLLVIGIINLHSATYDLNRGGISSLVWSQSASILIGLLIGFFFLLIDYRVLMGLSYPFYGLTILLLLLVVFFGKTVAGNRNWLQLGPMTFQPAEFAKISLVILLARFFSEHPPVHFKYRLVELLRPLILVGIPLSLILLGRDMGSTLFFFLTFGSILLFVGIDRRLLWVLLVLFLVGGSASYKFFLTSHQKSRVESFLNPAADPRGKGYHLLQSKITVGSGRLWGKGYLKGMHSKLLYLPEKHTDFIYPVLAEEWGFLGSVTVFGLYLGLLGVSLQIASRAKERFGVILGVGITALLFWQVTINLGGVLGLMPLTGVTLPFLSYGGSSIVTMIVAVCIMLNIAMRRFMF